MTTIRYYDDVAAAYDRVMGRWSRQDIPALPTAATVATGDRVLDVATGTGEVALAAAATVGARGLVVGVDLSLGMLQVARQKGIARRIPFVGMNGQALAFRDQSFDAVVCRLALMLFPDVSQGLREFLRMLRPGGRVTVSVWSRPERVPAYAIIFEAIARQLPDHTPEIMLGFSLCDVSRLEALLATAGFGDVRVVSDVRQLTFDSFDDYWSPFEAGGARPCQLYRRLPDQQRRAVVQEVREQVARFDSGGRLVMNVESLFGLARRI
jgi:SAM-dependent methyltransferase